MGKFRQISTELWPLIYLKNFVSGLFLEHLLTDFLQTLYRRSYQIGVVWYWRWVNFVKLVQSNDP